MLNERKQLEIIENQLSKALDIVIAQKRRYEQLQTNLCHYHWTCEDADKDNEIASNIFASIGSIECAIENLYSC